MDNIIAPWSWSAITQNGVLPYPADPDLPISWISHRTLAESIVSAATLVGAEGRVYRLGGPERVTGRDMASRISTKLGREVSYLQADLGEFATSLNAVFGDPVGDQIADLYRYANEYPTGLCRDGIDQDELGVPSEELDAFLARSLPQQ